jgi:hypothetical protein
MSWAMRLDVSARLSSKTIAPATPKTRQHWRPRDGSRKPVASRDLNKSEWFEDYVEVTVVLRGTVHRQKIALGSAVHAGDPRDIATLSVEKAAENMIRTLRA